MVHGMALKRMVYLRGGLENLGLKGALEMLLSLYIPISLFKAFGSLTSQHNNLIFLSG